MITILVVVALTAASWGQSDAHLTACDPTASSRCILHEESLDCRDLNLTLVPCSVPLGVRQLYVCADVLR